MIPDPRFAPRRDDLPFLRRRVRPRAPEPPAAPAASAVDYHRRDRDRPAPAPAPARAVRPAPASGGIDLTRRSSPPAQPPVSSLDLSATPPARPATPATPAAPRRAPRPVPPEPRPRRHVVRVSGDEQRRLDLGAPTVTLTRLQSGVGSLDAHAICSPEVGDLRLGAAYQLRSGGSGVVQHADGIRFAPSARRPVVVSSRDDDQERVGVDLRQVGDVERVAIYAYSPSRTALAWGGALVVTLLGGARLEVALDTLPAGHAAMLMTLYAVEGELVVRAELETVEGDVRELARAYGFDRITWRDARTPID